MRSNSKALCQLFQDKVTHTVATSLRHMVIFHIIKPINIKNYVIYLQYNFTKLQINSHTVFKNLFKLSLK